MYMYIYICILGITSNMTLIPSYIIYIMQFIYIIVNIPLTVLPFNHVICNEYIYIYGHTHRITITTIHQPLIAFFHLDPSFADTAMARPLWRRNGS